MRGGSQSHLMRCSDGNYYVVKFKGNPQGTRILANEFLGTKLAALLGLPTTATAIVEVSEGLIQLTPDMHFELPRSGFCSRIPCPSGLQFGSRYPGDPHNLTVFDLLPREKVLLSSNLADFLGMLVFDIWTGNTDGRQVIFGRTEVGNPYQAWMIDQGFCFNAGDWNFSGAPRKNLYIPDVVYRQAQGLNSFEPWLNRLETEIGADSLAEIASGIPAEWYGSDSASIEMLLYNLNQRRSKVRRLLAVVHEDSPQVFPNWIVKSAATTS